MPQDFAPNSRYARQPLLALAQPGGTSVPYLARRIIPAAERFTPFDSHKVQGDERVDAVAAAAYGDALQYWRICDANAVADPADTCRETGRRLVLPLPLEVSDHGQS